MAGRPVVDIKFTIAAENLRALSKALSEINRGITLESEKLAERLMKGYIFRLKEAIVTQKYAGRYAPYSESYERKIRGQRINPKLFWSFSGTLINSLVPEKMQSFNIRNKTWAYRLRISKEVNPFTKGNVREYAYLNETGRGGYGHHPARPLFKPTWDDFMQNDYKRIMTDFENNLVSVIKKAG